MYQAYERIFTRRREDAKGIAAKPLSSSCGAAGRTLEFKSDFAASATPSRLRVFV
jgi:hypothetical protein